MRQAHSDRPRLPTPAGLPARDAWVLQQIASLVGESCEALPPRHPASYERLIRQALATTDSATPAERPFVPQLQRWWAAGLVGVGLCAAASLLLLWRPTTSTTGNAVAGELRQGSIRVGDAPIVAGDDVPAGPPLSSDEGAELQLEDADITLAMHTTIRWERHRRLVRLERGQVDVSVKPPFGESFRVATPRFTVEVTGTRFAVDLRSVRVHEGSVRVRDRTGALIAEHIRAGEHWDWEQTPTASANPNAGDKVDWPAPAGARQGAEVMPVPGETTAPAASRLVSGADRHAFKARPAAQARKTKSRPPRDKTAASPGAAPSPRSDIGRSLKAAAQALRRGDFTAARAAVMR
ncbi:MAG: FecR domain-containing protein, partial [Polyangiales bacterium]